LAPPEDSLLLRQMAFLQSDPGQECDIAASPPDAAEATTCGDGDVTAATAAVSFGTAVDDLFARWAQATVVEVCREAILSGQTPLAQVFFQQPRT